MGTDGVDHFLADSAFTQKLRRFYTVFFRELLKVNIMKKSGNAPEFFLIGVTQLFCESAHSTLYRQRMLDMKALTVVFL